MPQTQSYGELQTSDLYFAAYLQAVGLRMVRTERENNRVIFIFDSQGEDDEALKRDYYADAEVPALSYGNAIKNLKSRVHV
jgi:hypothetical protein